MKNGGGIALHFLKISDWTAEELEQVVRGAAAVKRRRREVQKEAPLAGRTLAMIFERPSTRTRVAFEVGMLELGGQAIVLKSEEMQLGRGEPIEDTARVLSRYVDAVMIRTTVHERIEAYAAASAVPVINGLTDRHHPTQVVADLLTVLEKKGTLRGVKIAYVGDGWNNVTHSWIEAAALLGLDLAVAAPDAYAPDPSIVAWAEAAAAESGARFLWTTDPVAAVADRDVVITDVWTSMGREAEAAERRAILGPYQVNDRLLASARPDAIVLHCLPAHRGEEVTADVLDGPRSVIFDEAENRLHAHKAILLHLFGRLEAVLTEAAEPGRL
ncbi:MAG: ornithine carbamoyltransferase [Hydrogenibacillus schlegelii]|nr:ornithine carbamoyltransferase [Hydrogenibacillus schlegelii]